MASGSVASENLDSIILRCGQRLGYDSIRLNQFNAIKSFMEGNDVFIILPTGSGKSLCFTILPFAFDCLYQRDSSIVIVVSPLIALMKDQVAILNSKGLLAAYLSSEMNDRAQQERILRGEVRVLFIGPELLMLNTLWRDMLTTPVYKENLVAFAVDEAHCVAKWGDYFRQEFKHLGEVRSLIPPHVHMMALTATATVSTRDSVVKILGMNNPTIVSVSPDKPNISYAVREKGSIEDAFSPLLNTLRSARCQMPRVIIYCRRVEHCSQLYRFFLSAMKYDFTEPPGAPNIAMFRLVDMFTSVTRNAVKESIIASLQKRHAPLRIVICTNAFGMGVDCTDVCKVIHWGPPSDIESYVQECGRAGRNGQPAQAVLFWKKADFRPYSTKDMQSYCTGKDVCRRAKLMSYFDCTYESKYDCSCCDVCSHNFHCDKCNCNSFPI